ncbi:hypothetical protein glysoja_028702 [Glycine soja]|uniref:Peroxidase n=1 Tax=Glycine soja TaxID=3848 RepID=A0A0B2NY29_GLYSO|nr:hypothetical protein glysoja_028702 [Glycine soja]
MVFSVFSAPYVHPELHPIVAKMTLFDTILFYVIHFVDKLELWQRLPVLLGLAYLGIRRHLHYRYNLLHAGGVNGHKYDTQEYAYTTPDGMCNHPADHLISSQGTSFGRNMPPTTLDYGDGSVIYGNNEKGMKRARTFKDGKLKISEDGLLEHDEKGIPISGDVRNCWAGFSLLQALFVKEHNALCDMLKTDTLLAGMRINGMHSLLPDEIVLRDIKPTRGEYKCPPILEKEPMKELLGKEGERRLSNLGMEQMLVSMGHQSSGAVDLWNYPTWLGNLIAHDINGEDIPDPVDMATMEENVAPVYRDRERGVARYNEFRRNLLMIPISKWEDLTDDEEVIEALRDVYEDDAEKLDLIVGLHAEKRIRGFAISETAFFIFLIMAWS